MKDFATKEPRRCGVQCWLCTIPERAEIEALRATVQLSTIRRWLIEDKGYPAATATKSRVSNHFAAGHHVAPKRKR